MTTSKNVELWGWITCCEFISLKSNMISRPTTPEKPLDFGSDTKSQQLRTCRATQSLLPFTSSKPNSRECLDLTERTDMCGFWVPDVNFYGCMQLVSKKCGNTYSFFFEGWFSNHLRPRSIWIHRSCVKTEIIWSCLKIPPFFRIKSFFLEGKKRLRLRKPAGSWKIVPQSHHQQTDRWISATWIGVTVHGKHLGTKIAETNGGTQGRTQKNTQNHLNWNHKIQKDSKTEEALLKYAAFWFDDI